MTKTPEISNSDIALFALYLLGGGTKKIFTEDVAQKCFEIAPKKFTWRKYKYPDLDTVRMALVNAKRLVNGTLVKGRYGKATGSKIVDGWILTPEGITWLKKNKEWIESMLGKGEVHSDRQESERQLKEMRDSNAFIRFQKDGQKAKIMPYEFTDFLNASLDTPSAILNDRISRARAIAANAGDEGLLIFIKHCENGLTETLNL